MSEWITDRRPNKQDDPDVVYAADGKAKIYYWIAEGEAWKPIPKCEPYVKPKRWTVREYFGRYFVVASNDYDTINGFGLPTREAAERIAAIYEEVMP